MLTQVRSGFRALVVCVGQDLQNVLGFSQGGGGLAEVGPVVRRRAAGTPTGCRWTARCPGVDGDQCFESRQGAPEILTAHEDHGALPRMASARGLWAPSVVGP
ncbi:hypothetical protein SUDANB5_02188 [Streptomyces sp. SudanB5_2050]